MPAYCGLPCTRWARAYFHFCRRSEARRWLRTCPSRPRPLPSAVGKRTHMFTRKSKRGFGPQRWPTQRFCCFLARSGGRTTLSSTCVVRPLVAQPCRQRYGHSLQVRVLSMYTWRARSAQRAYIRGCGAGWRRCEAPTLRAIGNAWPTSRRIGGAPNRCAYGCASVGGDDVVHYFACPVLRAVMLGSAARVPGWAHEEGRMRIVALTLPLSADQVVISGVWAYIAYAMFCDGRAREHPRSTEYFIVIARAEMRSLCTRVPIAHKALFSVDGGRHRLPRLRRGSLGL